MVTYTKGKVYIRIVVSRRDGPSVPYHWFQPKHLVNTIFFADGDFEQKLYFFKVMLWVTLLDAVPPGGGSTSTVSIGGNHVVAHDEVNLSTFIRG